MRLSHFLICCTALFVGVRSSEARADEALDALVSALEADSHEVASYYLGFGVGSNSVVNVRREFGSSAIEAGAVLTLLPIGSGWNSLLRFGGRVNWLSFGNSTGDRSIYRGVGLGYFSSMSFQGDASTEHPSLQLITGYEVGRNSQLKWYAHAELDISGERLVERNSSTFPVSLMFSVGGALRLTGDRP